MHALLKGTREISVRIMRNRWSSGKIRRSPVAVRRRTSPDRNSKILRIVAWVADVCFRFGDTVYRRYGITREVIILAEMKNSLGLYKKYGPKKRVGFRFD